MIKSVLVTAYKLYRIIILKLVLHFKKILYTCINSLDKKALVSEWANCSCDAELINGIVEFEKEWDPRHHTKGGFGTRFDIISYTFKC